MPELPVDIKPAVEAYRAECSLSPPLDRLLARLTSDSLGSLSRLELWAGEEVPPSGAIQDSLAGFVLFLISFLLDDHHLSAAEQATIALVKRLFYVEEGELLSLQRDAIIDLLRGEVCLILQDNTVNPEEAIHQVDLQTALGLSYDQYLELTEEFIRQVAEDIVAPLLQQPPTHELEEKVLAQLRLLDTVLPLDPQTLQFHWGESAAGLGGGDVHGRAISQAVKDAVWRRDQGKCAQCGSQVDLEFDHIVPFSKGGLNTYRNIQLLCGACNSTKSAHIG